MSELDAQALSLGVDRMPAGVDGLGDDDAQVERAALQAEFAASPGAIQATLAVFLLGLALTGGESITVRITSGSAFIYGATTDNKTNDPSIQFARRVD